jgi:signal transduction histidine kinase
MRRRLTLGYVGIFALILLLLGVAVTLSFSRQASAQQDDLLEGRARATLDYVSNALLRPDRAGPDDAGPEDPARSDEPSPREPPVGPIGSATDGDIGLLALRLSPGGEAEVLDRSPLAPSLGLPAVGAARTAARTGAPTRETIRNPNGEEVRVVSVPVVRPGGGVDAVVQAAQPRSVVRERVRGLVLVLASVGLVGLVLAGVGGLFMSRRAMRPVEDSFRRQRAFIADASHELKTPLALVRIDAEVMRRHSTSPESREMVEDQLDEIDRMDALLADLLTLARLDDGRLAVENEPFDLGTVAAEAAGRFLTRAAEEGVRLEVEIPEDLVACGDAGRTDQVLAVLLDNAIRHTPKGGTITVSARRLGASLGAPRGAPRVEVRVSDTGPGITPEHLPRIFDRFYRAEEARTRVPSGGAGLGLSIARDLARHMGGDLSAENAPEGGAVFRLELPAR